MLLLILAKAKAITMEDVMVYIWYICYMLVIHYFSSIEASVPVKRFLIVFACFVCSQFKVCPKSQCVSTPGHRTDLFLRSPGSVLITDFFGSVRKVELTMDTVHLPDPVKPVKQR